jgi:peptide/nickel transport system substrate-binding protein
LALFGSALAAGALVLSACSSSSGGNNGAASNGVPTGGTKQPGGTVRWAEPPGSPPNYIFPFMSLATASVDNISQFQYLMYRPLYIFGTPQTNQVTLNEKDSLAQDPVYSNNNQQAVINLKNYKWSNGETVDANDVLFFLNMLHSQKANWYAYSPGTIPDNVTKVTVDSPTQLTLTFDRSYNSFWMTYNELSQITPFPKAWDVTASGQSAGSGKCSSDAYGSSAADSDCGAVYNFLAAQAKDLTTYASNPIWSIVDGPFKLSSFDSSGNITMVPNASYSGPTKATIAEFKQVPFTTDDAEFNSLVGNDLDIGYLPTQDVTASTSDPQQAGPNNPRLTNFYMNPWILFGFNYASINMNSTGNNGTAGAILRQAYVRQAMASLVDQPLYIKQYLKGYAVPTYGPVPSLPPNPYPASKNNPFPYDPAKAASLLSSHGWKVNPGGTDTCTNAGTGSNQCGAGIPAGTPLTIHLEYATGTVWQTQVLNAERAGWAQEGINVQLTGATFDTVIGDTTPCSPGPSCTWEINWYGGGWEYSPDQYPTGDELYSTGAGSNAGSYSDPQADSLIKATYQSNTSLADYNNYMSSQVPVLWEPNADYSLTEIRSDLRGVAPQNPFAVIYPEEWYYVK